MRNVSKALRITHHERGNVGDGLDEQHAVGALAHGAFNFRVTFVADHHNFVIFLAVTCDFEVDFGNQGASGVEDFKASLLGFFAHALWNAVCTENNCRAGRNIAQLINEYGSFGAQIIADKFVVHDFVANVDRSTEFFNGAFNNGNGAFNAGTEAAGCGENDLHKVPGLIWRQS